MLAIVSRIAVFVTVLTFGSTALAQITFDGCRDFRGQPVASILNTNVPDVAIATYYNGAPVIMYNPYVLAQLSPATRLFFYAHECAHHVLAHAIRNIPFSAEQEADCWGVRTLVEKGMLSDSDINDVQRDISRSQGDWTHLPGPQRAINLRACLRRAGSAGPDPRIPPPPRQQLFCCDGFGRRWCAITVNPGPIGAPCACAGVPGTGRMCP